MKRYTVVKHMINLLHGNDVMIFSGQALCEEAFEHYKDNHFYINGPAGVAVSVALGMAMCTDKRIFVFIGEGELLRELGVLVQMGASKCRNMFLIILDNGCYQSAGGHPNIFESLLSKRGFMYNANMRVSTFTKHLKGKHRNNLRNRFERLVGPMVILMDVDRGIKRNLTEVDIDFEEQKDRISKLILDPTKETSLFISPIMPSSNNDVNTLDLDSLQTGGIN